MNRGCLGTVASEIDVSQSFRADDFSFGVLVFCVDKRPSIEINSVVNEITSFQA